MNDKNLCYHCLAHPVFSETMFASTVSRGAIDVHKYMPQTLDVQRAFPIAFRNEAYETLMLLFVRDEVLPACVCDNAKEMVQGKFYQKLKEAACHLKQLEPYTLWSNATKREMK